MKKGNWNPQLTSDLSVKGLRFLFCSQSISMCTCQEKEYNRDHNAKPNTNIENSREEAVKVLELVVPMSVIGLVSDVNTCFLEKLSIVVDNLVANSITQKDILESFNNYDTAKDIQDKVLKSIVPEMVANGFCHVSLNKLSM